MSTENNTHTSARESAAEHTLRMRLQALPTEAPDVDRLPAVLTALEATPASVTASHVNPRVRVWAGACAAAASLALVLVWKLPTPANSETSVPTAEVLTQRNGSTEQVLKQRSGSTEQLTADAELMALMERSRVAEADFLAARESTRTSIREWENQQLATLALHDLDRQLERHAMETRSSTADPTARRLWQARVQTLDDANQGRLYARVRYVD
jgi:hypothetical protein